MCVGVFARVRVCPKVGLPCVWAAVGWLTRNCSMFVMLFVWSRNIFRGVEVLMSDHCN